MTVLQKLKATFSGPKYQKDTNYRQSHPQGSIHQDIGGLHEELWTLKQNLMFQANQVHVNGSHQINFAQIAKDEARLHELKTHKQHGHLFSKRQHNQTSGFNGSESAYDLWEECDELIKFIRREKEGLKPTLKGTLANQMSSQFGVDGSQTMAKQFVDNPTQARHQLDQAAIGAGAAGAGVATGAGFGATSHSGLQNKMVGASTGTTTASGSQISNNAYGTRDPHHPNASALTATGNTSTTGAYGTGIATGTHDGRLAAGTAGATGAVAGAEAGKKIEIHKHDHQHNDHHDHKHDHRHQHQHQHDYHIAGNSNPTATTASTTGLGSQTNFNQTQHQGVGKPVGSHHTTEKTGYGLTGHRTEPHHQGVHNQNATTAAGYNSNTPMTSAGYSTTGNGLNDSRMTDAKTHPASSNMGLGAGAAGASGLAAAATQLHHRNPHHMNQAQDSNLSSSHYGSSTTSRPNTLSNQTVDPSINSSYGHASAFPASSSNINSNSSVLPGSKMNVDSTMTGMNRGMNMNQTQAQPTMVGSSTGVNHGFDKQQHPSLLDKVEGRTYEKFGQDLPYNKENVYQGSSQTSQLEREKQRELDANQGF